MKRDWTIGVFFVLAMIGVMTVLADMACGAEAEVSNSYGCAEWEYVTLCDGVGWYAGRFEGVDGWTPEVIVSERHGEWTWLHIGARIGWDEAGVEQWAWFWQGWIPGDMRPARIERDGGMVWVILQSVDECVTPN